MDNSDKSNNRNNNIVAQEKQEKEEEEQNSVISTAIQNNNHNNNIFLPTILENDYDEDLLNNNYTVIQSPSEILPPHKTFTTSIIEHKNSSNNLSPSGSGNSISRPNTPDTDKTAVESSNNTNANTNTNNYNSNNSFETTPLTTSHSSSRSNSPSGNNNNHSSSSSNSSNSSSILPSTSHSHIPDDIDRLPIHDNNGDDNVSPLSSQGSLTPSNIRSRSNTPDINNNSSNNGNGGGGTLPINSKVSHSLQTNDDLPEMKPIKEPLTSSNFIHVGIPAEINFPSANIKETVIGVFHIFNPKDNPVSWSLKPASIATFRRLGAATTAAIKLDEEVFSVRRTSGYLKAKNAVRVDVHFLPTGVGTYMQTFVLEDTVDGEATSAVGIKFQGIATENAFSALLQKKRMPRKEVKFEIEETELKMPPTRIGRQRTMGIKIINVSKESIRLNCKCETISGPGGKFVLSIAMNTVVVKADGFAVILVRFQPKSSGEVKGTVTVQSLGNAEVKVDVIAKGVRETSSSQSATITSPPSPTLLPTSPSPLQLSSSSSPLLQSSPPTPSLLPSPPSPRSPSPSPSLS